MSKILMAGSAIVTIALIAYTIAIIQEQRKKAVIPSVLLFFGFGLLLDISGTVCMIVGSSNSPFTTHGIIGYSALIAMILENTFLWRVRLRQGKGASMPQRLNIYSLVVYFWWVFVYVSGFIRSMN